MLLGCASVGSPQLFGARARIGTLFTAAAALGVVVDADAVGTQATKAVPMKAAVARPSPAVTRRLSCRLISCPFSDCPCLIWSSRDQVVQGASGVLDKQFGRRSDNSWRSSRRGGVTDHVFRSDGQEHRSGQQE